MTRHVDVGVVAGRRLVLDVGDVDGDAALALLRRLVDPVEPTVVLDSSRSRKYVL